MTSDEGRPAKVYVEPTNACNLACTTCVRHAWDEPEGFMEWATFEAVVDGVAGPGAEAGPGTVAFMGLGEPLMHPRFLDMVRPPRSAACAPRSPPTRCCWTTRRRPASSRPAWTSSWSASTAPPPRPSAACAPAPRSRAWSRTCGASQDHRGPNYASVGAHRCRVRGHALQHRRAARPAAPRRPARRDVHHRQQRAGVHARTCSTRRSTTARGRRRAARTPPPAPAGSCRRSTGTPSSAPHWARRSRARARSRSTAPTPRTRAAAARSSTRTPAPWPGTAA